MTEKKDYNLKTARIAAAALEDKKAENIRIIDISEISPLADYFIISNGSNKNQIQALADNVSEKLGCEGCEKLSYEGYDTAGWILMDYGDIVIHIFDKESRAYYNLDRIWNDGKEVDLH